MNNGKCDEQDSSGELVDENAVFTPLDATRNKRLCFKLSDVVVLNGDLDIREIGKKARVRIGTEVYDVYGHPCDLEGCNCDAYIKPVGQSSK